MTQYSGNIVDIVARNIYPGTITIDSGLISEITKDNNSYTNYLIPGFVDAHIHIESSMLTPVEFSKIAVRHGTVAVVTDSHEIANVLGIKGIEYMIESSRNSLLKIFHSAPSCVPATTFETAGGEITAKDIEYLFKKYSEVKVLGEVMNYPGVIARAPKVMEKIVLAKKYNKIIDGHSPELSGAALQKYIEAGIQTDHECVTLEEAREKIRLGVFILLREGSAAKNFDTLLPLLIDSPNSCAFCSDDKHPDDLIDGHINQLVIRALRMGCNLFDVLRAASANPANFYNLPVGLLQIQDPADFLVVDSLKEFTVLATVINGKEVFALGKEEPTLTANTAINNFHALEKSANDFVLVSKETRLPVIEILDSQLITLHGFMDRSNAKSNTVNIDLDQDILKVAVVNRYQNVKPAVGLIKNFGLKRGAVASSIAHDSHNIIVVGTNDDDLARAVNNVVTCKGGISVVSASDHINETLQLSVAGLMSVEDGESVSKKFSEINRLVKELGSNLSAPLMTLSFMALLVIPNIKISDKGMFDSKNFAFLQY